MTARAFATPPDRADRDVVAVRSLASASSPDAGDLRIREIGPRDGAIFDGPSGRIVLGRAPHPRDAVCASCQ